MEPLTLTVSTCGVGSPPKGNWYLSRDIEVQRLYYILGGTGSYTGGDGRSRPFRSGGLYLFPYNLRDRFWSDPDDPIRHLYFDFLSTPPVIAPEPLFCVPEQESDLAAALTLAIRLAGPRPEPALSGSLLELLLRLTDAVMPLPLSRDRMICRTVETVRTRFAQPLTVAELAREAGFEENYFIRRFRATMGQTPYAYLRNYRLMEARRLLEAGETLTRTAPRVGYETAAALSRALCAGKRA